MALILKYIDSIHRYMETNGDERTKDWPMMSSPFPTLAVCLTYVYVVKVLGPRLMENRKPFQLQNVMLIYNAVQVIFSTWLFYEIAFSGWLTGDYNLRCQPVDYSNNPRTLRMVHACWWYYFSKFTEFFDTIFFVLRKKNSQVSTLHVIHHGCMPMSVWFGVKFTPGGHSTFFGLLNTFVHIVMYFYYMMSALGPSVRPYLWWKKYLTTLQMAQFILIMLHAFQLLFIDCNYPKAFVWWIGMHAVMFFFLFNEFYKNAYKSRRTQYKNLLMFLLQRREKEVYGTSSAVVNGDESHQLLLANGHHSKTNGHVQSNGYANGKINGANSGLTNGYKYDQLSNGQATHMSNGKVSSSSTYKNGHAVPVANGGYTQTELIQRKQTDK